MASKKQSMKIMQKNTDGSQNPFKAAVSPVRSLLTADFSQLVSCLRTMIVIYF